MANHPVGSQAPCSGDGSEDAPIVVVVGAGSEPTTAVREALALRDVVDALAIALRQKGIVAPPNRDRVLVVDAPARRQAAEPWWERLGIGIMAMLLLVGSVLLPSGRSAQAEATLGEPIPVALNPFGVEVNSATNRIYAVNLGIDGQGHGSDGTVTVIDGATNAVIGTPITVGMQPATVGVNPNTGRIYTANLASLTVSVIGTPFSIAPNMASSGSTATATWSSLFAPNGSDFVGLFEPGAPTPRR